MNFRTLLYAVFLPIFMLLGVGFAALVMYGVEREAKTYGDEACLAQLNSLGQMILGPWYAGRRTGPLNNADKESLHKKIKKVCETTDAIGIWVFDASGNPFAKNMDYPSQEHDRLELDVASHLVNQTVNADTMEKVQDVIVADVHAKRSVRQCYYVANGASHLLASIVLDVSEVAVEKRVRTLEMYLLIAAGVVSIIGVFIIAYLGRVIGRDTRLLKEQVSAIANNISDDAEAEPKIREIGDLIKTLGILRDVRKDLRKRAAREQMEKMKHS